MIKPRRFPEEIMGEDEFLVRTTLEAFRKSGISDWDSFAVKLDGSTRDTLAKIFYECRCNGFYQPQVINDKVVFGQLVHAKKRKPRNHELTVADMKEKSLI